MLPYSSYVFRLGEACNHIAALLFALEDYVKNHSTTTSDDIACTSKPCEWNKPRKRKLSPKRIEEIRSVKHQYGKVPRLAAVPSDVAYKACPTLSNSVVSNLLDSLRLVSPQSAIFTAIEKQHTVFLENEISSDSNIGAYEEVSSCLLTESPSTASIDEGPQLDTLELNKSLQSDQDNFFHVGCISPFAALPPSLKNIEEKCRSIKRKLNFNEEEIQQVEKKTRLQSRDSDWYLYRKGRITASKCKRVASLKPTTSPSKTLKELLMINKVPQTSAMLQGLENEDAIADSFVEKMKTEGNHDFSFANCGFFISKTHGFLGASPDRIVHDPTEETPGVAEFKFIQVKDKEGLSGVLLKQHICIKTQKGNSISLKLNRNHKYFYQLYQQMFVTELHWGLFIAKGSDGCIFHEKVRFATNCWLPILDKLENFFESFLMQELAYPRVQLGLDRKSY